MHCCVDVAQNGWVNHVKPLCFLCMIYLLSVSCLMFSAVITPTIGIGAGVSNQDRSIGHNGLLHESGSVDFITQRREIIKQCSC